MPSIRLNQEIRLTIKRGAAAAFDKANPEIEIPVTLIEKLRQALMADPLVVAFNAFVKTNKSLLDTTKYSTTTNKVQALCEGTKVTLLDVFPEDLTQPTNRSRLSKRISLPTPLDLPINTGWCPDLYLSEVTPELRGELNDEWNEHTSLVEARTEARRVYKAKIDALVNGVNTTGQFLEAWPAGIELLPSDVVQKMHQKVTRKAKVQAIKEKVQFDDTAASSVLMTAKLLGE